MPRAASTNKRVISDAKASSDPRRTAGRPTLVELEYRKERVLRVALALFLRHGYAATSVIKIAKVAKVSTRMVYQHFRSKHSLFRHVIYDLDAKTQRASVEIEAGQTILERLMNVARYVREIMLLDASVELMQLLLAERNRLPDVAMSLAGAQFERLQSRVEQEIVGLATDGNIESGDHTESARIFIDLILGQNLVKRYGEWGGSDITEDELGLKVNVFIAGKLQVKGPGLISAP